MNRPKMVLFDYGQTLVAEGNFIPRNGNKALLERTVKNPHNITIDELQEQAIKMLDRFTDLLSTEKGNRNRQLIDVTWNSFNQYIYTSLGLEFDISYDELQWIFWTSSTSAKPTDNIEKLLDFLYKNNIRTGVVSNIMYSGKTLKRRIDKYIPNNRFEFIIASSEYMFRKPYHEIFDIAIEKAKLNADEIWFCGDNLICDVEGSDGVGMKPVHYDKYADKSLKIEKDIDYINISDWTELIELISSL